MIPLAVQSTLVDLESDKNKYSADDFIAFMDTFFVLWEDKEDFRSHILIYLATLKRVKGFATNDTLVQLTSF